MSERAITLQEFRDAGYCVKGQKRMCALVGFDFRELVKNGIPLDQARQIPGIESMVADVMKRRKARES